MFFVLVTIIDEIPETATPDARNSTEPVVGVKDMDGAVKKEAIVMSVHPGPNVHDGDTFAHILACKAYDEALKSVTLYPSKSHAD